MELIFYYFVEILFLVIIKFDFVCVLSELFQLLGKFVVFLVFVGIVRFHVLDVCKCIPLQNRPSLLTF